MPHQQAEEMRIAQADPTSRTDGWQHYYEYFHKLDADMQVRAISARSKRPRLRDFSRATRAFPCTI